MSKIKILFVSANPTGTTPLKLDEEVREIEAKIRAAEHRDTLELITKWAARPDDLLQSLNQHRPHIVHFSGHGNPTEELVLLDKEGRPKTVTKEALVNLFRTLKDNIRVVLLNACFSKPQAEAITGEIDCAIGMSRAIGDDAAIVFAASFYRAIGFGRTIKEAFDQGKTALLLESIPEESTPTLLIREGIAPNQIELVPMASTADWRDDTLTSRLAYIASAILTSAENSRGQQKDQLLRTADGLAEIATCIESIIGKFQDKKWSEMVGRCEELGSYLKHFNKFNLGPMLGDEKTALLEQLENAVSARRGGLLAGELDWSGRDTEREKQLADLRRAAGSFRAASTLLRTMA